MTLNFSIFSLESLEYILTTVGSISDPSLTNTTSPLISVQRLEVFSDHVLIHYSTDSLDILSGIKSLTEDLVDVDLAFSGKLRLDNFQFQAFLRLFGGSCQNQEWRDVVFGDVLKRHTVEFVEWVLWNLGHKPAIRGAIITNMPDIQTFEFLASIDKPKSKSRPTANFMYGFNLSYIDDQLTIRTSTLNPNLMNWVCQYQVE